MQTQLSHLQFNIKPENMPFYADLLAHLGWKSWHADEGMLGVGDKNGVSLWFVAKVKAVSNDYDGPGLNHLAIGANSTGDVDLAAAYLAERDVELLFETPRHRPEFSLGPDQTYYQIMFETPDRILVEIVYMGPLDG